MELFKQNSKIDFMRIRKLTGGVSLVLCIIAVILLFAKGLNWGLDFTGGTQVEVAFTHTVNTAEIRDKLVSVGLDDAVVQSYGSARDILINLGVDKAISQDETVARITQALPDGDIRRVDFVGPQVGQELANKGAMAFIIALLGILMYVAFRFEYRLAASSVIALLHDPLIILGCFALFQWEFDLTVFAAILAVVGYSLNDTIVVFDRVRENFRKLHKTATLDVMNISINQTLSRTIITSFATLLVLIALLVYGGEIIRGFSIALSLGVIVGTYSSIYIAGSLAIMFGLDRKDLLPPSKDDIDDRP